MACTKRFLLFLSLVLLVGCQPTEDPVVPAADDVPVIEETFLTTRDVSDNVDSPAVWHGPDDQHLLLVTAKEGNFIRVSSATDGSFIREVGTPGSELSQFRRPNGIAVVDDLMLVVERDNARVQVFALPSFEALGTFGEGFLQRPYGLFVYAEAPGQYTVYVTDNYETPDGSIPPDSDLGERVQHYRFSVDNGTLSAEHVRAFGDTEGSGTLRVVESIWGDPPNDRLLISEEESGDSQIKIYTLDGTFTGDVIDPTFFPHESEGIVLYACDDGDGYWIAVNQHDEFNTFHVFDRTTFEHAGAFRAATVANTDGIALTQHAFGPFPAGAFFAVHDDGGTGAFDWEDIAEAMILRTDCVTTSQ